MLDVCCCQRARILGIGAVVAFRYFSVQFSTVLFITMLSFAARRNSACLWLFALFGLGWIQQISSDGTFFSASPQPANGEWKPHPVEGTKLQRGNRSPHSCYPGYMITRTKSIFCMQNGKLSVVPTYTEAKCNSLPTSSHYTVSCELYGKWLSCQDLVPAGTKARITCRSGYRKESSRRSTDKSVWTTCTMNGKWKRYHIRCVPDCGMTAPRYQSLAVGKDEIQVKKVTVSDASSRPSDIALLELRKPFKTSSLLMPVCLDYTGNSESTPKLGDWGGVATFGGNARGKPGKVLQTLNVRYVSGSPFDASNFNRRNEDYLFNTDEIRRGHTNGISSALHKSDSGSGLVYSTGNRWYLDAVVDHALNRDTSKIFTNVFHYAPWIHGILTKPERKGKHPPYSPTTTETPVKADVTPSRPIEDDSCEENINCKKVIEGRLCIPNDPCSLRDRTETGVYSLLSNCQSVPYYEILENKEAHVRCKNIGKQPVVCCPKTKPTPVPRGAIARQKCSEYKEHVYTLRRDPVIGRGFLKVSECAFHFQNLMYIKDDVAEAAEPKKFPHMAAVGFASGPTGIKWNCSGSIISERFILTAAHCANHEVWGKASWVLVGDLNLEGTTSGAKPQKYRVTNVSVHPEYKPPAFYHDIALLRLETNITFNGWTRPACLHTSATDTRKATATGWGIADEDDEEDSNYLRRTIMPIVDSQSCKTRWQGKRGERKLPEGINGNWSICAGGPCVDTFQADTGGSLVIYSKREYYCMYDIVGVSSIARSCPLNHPGIYTRVYHYVPWIESIVWRSN